METTTIITTIATTFNAGAVLQNSATTVEGQIMATVASVLPLGLAIIGAVIAVTFGIKFLRKVTKG